MKEIPTVDASLRPEMGKLLNQAKNEVTELIDQKKQSFYLRVQKYLLILTVRFLESFLQAEDFIL